MRLSDIIFPLFSLSLIIIPQQLMSAVPESFQNSLQDTSIYKNGVQQPVYTTYRLSTVRPVIDGKLDDDCWKTGTWAGDYHQSKPNEGAKPTYPTFLKILYDDRNLYVAMRAFDGEPKKIQRLSGTRDEQVGDQMGVVFDSYHDYRTGFEFTITAWGQQVDIVMSNPRTWDKNWNAVWKGETGLEDSAWVAELEIPLSQLRYSKKDEQVWGMHTWRLINRLGEESNWEIQSKTSPGVMFNFGELRGIKGLKKSQRLEIKPYMLGELKTMKKEPGNPFNEKGRLWGGNAGIDAKIGISSNFTLDMTINPDFGQVESDPSVMNLSAFEVLFEEKRSFFLEGSTIFNYEVNDQSLFYSRRIGHSPSLVLNPEDNHFVKSPDMTSILSALKLSGTTSKGLSVGLIQSVTANEFARLADSDGNRNSMKVEPLTSYTIARIQQGYKEGNTVIGGMLTSTNRSIDEGNLSFLADNAFTGGFDVLHHMKDKEFYIDARLIGSYIKGNKTAITALQESSARYFQRPGADYLKYDTTKTSLSGFGGKFKIGKGSKGFWRYSTEVAWSSPGLELNDLGYMKSADEINQTNEVSYFVNQPVSVFRTYEIGLEQFNKWNFDGAYLGSGSHFSFESEFRNKLNFNANMIYHTKSFDPRLLRGGNGMKMPFTVNLFGELRTDRSKKIIAELGYDFERSGNNSRTLFEIEPGLTIRPVNALILELSANYEDNYDKLQYIETKDYLSEKRYLLGTIDQKTFGLTFRVDLNITPKFTIQYYGSPYISRGTYSEIKYITDPEAKLFGDRFDVFSNPQIVGDEYRLDENNDQQADYSLINPDFNFHQFRSNFVAKWEYRLGSFIYFIWSGERTGSSSLSGASLGDSYNQLFDVFPKNIFLIKFNYWFSL